MEKQGKKLNINMTSPILASDGHQMLLNGMNGELTLMFLQVIPNPDPKGEAFANTIGNIRLNYEQAKNLRDNLDDNIKKFEEKR